MHVILVFHSMNKKGLSAILALVLSLSTSPFLAVGQEKKDILAVVGTISIDKEEFLQLMSKERESEIPANSLTRKEFEENFESFLTYKLKVIEAESIKLDQLEEFNLEFSSIKESLIASYLIKNSIEEGEIKKVYARLQEIIRAKHILFQFPPNPKKEDSIAVLQLALKVKTELENGGDFSALASNYSDDPSAKVNKGDLGYFTGLQMVQQFEEAAYTLPVGSISDPILTDFGYHIIQVSSHQANPGEVQVSHILVRFDSENPSQEENARRKISDIYAEIQKESTIWEEIVQTYSEDPATKSAGGLLPWFGVGTMLPEFEMAGFSLTEIGEVSPPIKTAYGYHILRLEGKRGLQPYEEMEQSIRSKILRNSKTGMIQSQVIAIQKSRYGFQENELGVSTVVEAVNATDMLSFGAAIQEKKLGNTELFKANTASYTVGDLVNFMQTKEITPKGSGTFFDLWLEKFTEVTLAETEEVDLEKNNKTYQLLLKEYRDGILLFSLTNQEVWQKGLNDSLGQQAFFEKNTQNYQWKGRVQAYLAKVNDASKLENARKYLQNKGFDTDSFAAFEADYRSNYPDAYATESGTFEYETHPILSKVDLDKPYQELVIDGTSYVLIVGKVHPPGPRKFEEARGLIIRDYQEFLDQALTKRLREKYPIQINAGVKEKAFAALNH